MTRQLTWIELMEENEKLFEILAGMYELLLAAGETIRDKDKKIQIMKRKLDYYEGPNSPPPQQSQAWKKEERKTREEKEGRIRVKKA